MKYLKEESKIMQNLDINKLIHQSFTCGSCTRLLVLLICFPIQNSLSTEIDKIIKEHTRHLNELENANESC